MAEMIPEYAVHASETTKKTHQKLSQMLGNGYKVVQYLNVESPFYNQDTNNNKIHPSKKTASGSLFWIKKGSQSLFIYISNTATDKITIDKNQQDTVRQALSNSAEIKAILQLQQSLLPKGLHAHKAKLIPILMFFPESNNNKIKIGIKSHGLYLQGKESLESAPLLKLLRTHMGMGLSHSVLNHMRRVFSPELILQQQNQPLLDDDQEIALKSELHLPIDARRSENYNLRVLNGVAGSGKTQVLIRRAQLIRTLFPTQKVLILCNNQAIKHSIALQYEALNRKQQRDRKITIAPFLDWCRQRLDISRDIVYEKDVPDILERVIKRHAKENNEASDNELTESTLLREIGFVKDRLIFTESDYLDIKRPEQQDNTLDENQKKNLWRAVMAFNHELTAKNKILWRDIPRLLLESTETGKLLEHYDHILVDEGQYFAPIHYTLIKKSLKPHGGQLFITFDENQGFLDNRIHIKETGLNLRGHSTRLLQSYRLNPFIMRAAHALHLNRLPEESDDIFSNSGSINPDKTITYRHPELLHFQSDKDEETRLIKEIHNLNKAGITAKDILIITSDSSNAHLLASAIRQNLKLSVDLPTLSNNNPDALQVCPLDFATGLERPYVFIIGIHHLFSDDLLSENKKTNESHARLIENTRKLYMGMTRASQKLTLMMVCDDIPEALITSHIKIPTVTHSTENDDNVRYLHG